MGGSVLRAGISKALEPLCLPLPPRLHRNTHMNSLTAQAVQRISPHPCMSFSDDIRQSALPAPSPARVCSTPHPCLQKTPTRESYMGFFIFTANLCQLGAARDTLGSTAISPSPLNPAHNTQVQSSGKHRRRKRCQVLKRDSANGGIGRKDRPSRCAEILVVWW